jgi:hypothetical protein
MVKQPQGTHKNAKESIKPTTPYRNKLEYLAKLVVIAKGAANRAKLDQLDVSQGTEVPMVNEFFDIFFEEL